MATSSDRCGGASAAAARTKSCTGLPARVTKVARSSAMRRGWWASRIVASAASPGQTALGPPLKPAKKCGSTNPVMMRTSASTYSRCSSTGVPSTAPTRTCAPVVRGLVVDDAVAGHEVGADQLLHLRRGGLPVRPGGAQEGDVAVGHPGAGQLGQQRRQHGAVRHGAGQVGEDHGHPARPRRQRRPAAARRRGRRSASVIAPASSARPGSSSGTTTSARSGTSTDVPWRP